MQPLTRGANITVAGCVLLELILAEQTRFDRGAFLGAGHGRLDPGLLAGFDVLDLEIAEVGHDRDSPTPRTSFAGSAVCVSRPMSTIWLVTCGSTIRLCLVSTAA